jgi:hypothetical protein
MRREGGGVGGGRRAGGGRRETQGGREGGGWVAEEAGERVCCKLAWLKDNMQVGGGMQGRGAGKEKFLSVT